MALALEQEIDNSGQIARYWRVRNVAVEFPTAGGAQVTVVLDGWLSEAAREAGKDPLPNVKRIVYLSMADADAADGLTKAAIYAAVKTAPDQQFSAATDV
mgnify:CR=1 FL=1